MKKIKITEAQQKLLEENGVIQYQDSGSEEKSFHTPIDKTHIDWDSKDPRFSDYDIDYNQQSVINVDWSVIMSFNINGIKFTPQIISANGFIHLKSYKTKDVIKIDINTKNGWKLQVSEHYFDYYENSLIINRVEIDLDNKTLNF